MIRIVVENIILFLLPTAVYIAYVALVRRSGGSKSTTEIMNEAPLLWLFTAGGLLVLIVLVVYASSSGGKPGQEYAPAVLRDGKIVPGELK